MKFLCDVHISLKISKKLEEAGHSSTHINTILNTWNTSDAAIAEYADKNDLILITKDQDFRNSFLLGQKPKKLIKVNLGNTTNLELWEMLEKNLEFLNRLYSENKVFMVEIGKNNLHSITV